MNITIIGTGFVGVVSAAVFAKLGNQVTGLDIDPKRIESLKTGKVPFFEPDLEELLLKGMSQKKLSFTTSYKEAISSADVIMIAVGTPSAPDGQADLRFVYSAAETLAPFLKEDAIVAIKSTVPPGTCGKVEQKMKEALEGKSKVFHVVSLPEFLKEGSAVADTLHPDRVIIGATVPSVVKVLKALHEPLTSKILVMHPDSAQMCKYAANAYLATRITFINQIANLCEANGANIEEVIKGIGLDKRIGSHYWYPGLGYGGSCFPKDVKELAAYARAVGQEDNLMVTINQLNEERIVKLLRQFEQTVGGFSGKKVAVLGLSFKPNTDDMREAPSTKVIPLLLHSGASVVATDPMALKAAKSWFSKEGLEESTQFSLNADVTQTLRGADVVLLLTEWKEYSDLSATSIAQLVSSTATVIDTRNQYARGTIEKTGLQYIGIGL
ncbi:UDP-glucose/GDP-mannose dehydrogenase family protein [Candidatus Woesebacteria bacterium]|nr:UDP-glucose/GDP-mannose dehydrogenase family protein [Candidatus Woesebacteria bacterium]